MGKVFRSGKKKTALIEQGFLLITHEDLEIHENSMGK